MHWFRFVFLGLLLLHLTQPAHSPAQPTSTATSALVPAEICDNCIDDDGDGAIDRADGDCPAPADGARVGLSDVGAAKSLDRCNDALQRAGAKLAWARLTLVTTCLKAAATCVQTR